MPKAHNPPYAIHSRTMPPHPSLHPRSRLTTSLFTSTLLLSFLVVGMPHILPCPRPRVEYSDEDPRCRRKKSGSQSYRVVDEQGLEESLRRGQGPDDESRNTQGQRLDERLKPQLEDTICGAKGRMDVARMELDRGREREEMEARRELQSCIDTVRLLGAIYLEAESSANRGVGEISFIGPNLSLL
ncbi:hypothetical protein G7Y79_00073g098480 [Physcia stellaris]|nr:hypothetical protein G7Y79_00073g098480 [Physcia stellaris]